MGVRVITSARLHRNLDRLGEEIHKQLKGAVVKTAINNIETPAKRNARVDTGRLRSSIHTKYGNTNSAYMYQDKEGGSFNGTLEENPTDTIDTFTCIVGTNVEYGGYLERRYPYLEPAFLNGRAKLPEELRKAYRKAVRKLSRG